jgi:hypothetical protein
MKTWLFEGPFWTVLACGIADSISLLRPSVVGDDTLLWFKLSPMQQKEAAVRIAFTFAMALLIRQILRRAAYFMQWTQVLYRALGDAVAATSPEEDDGETRAS